MENAAGEFTEKLNEWGKAKTPFFFLVDYQFQKPQAWKLTDIDPNEILFNLNGFTNDHTPLPGELPDPIRFDKYPPPFETYRPKFECVLQHLNAGNSFLVNLSVPTPISTNLSLTQIYQHSEAPYRLFFKDRFVCFSPEIFVRIRGNRIASFPMKGTIDASVPNAEQVILSDYKEAAEHATIVDLIRNDLSMVAEKVWVERYRYIDRIQTYDKALLQVSSEIAGLLPDTFNGQYGDLLNKLLPAGSITGAPKPRTLEIIEEAEQYNRGYYTGVMGYFDGENFESAVMIRFIERQDHGLVFKSGGGITALSNAKSEYQEVIDKVYLPFSYVPHAVL
ncbi:aminodeoxychorismate synthase component I [Dyadobacter beijingensis]|uniref:Aminodeoxychorismate synthase component I n=1 Tax=Dyadobacter beijingensis TaxID=365489 RepID=A0ABQ2IGL1_9BACT|nr:aminodeoxychorismate synthase component I [Dyadobacter beijingensis]GGN10504.1 aminodeoxychorismate synthase component I [Dyadobacter beijingensis]